MRDRCNRRSRRHRGAPPSLPRRAKPARSNLALNKRGNGWSSAHAGIVTDAVASSRVLNPCIILDEIDKVHAGKNGDIQGELLGLLERDEARRYFERYPKATVDASHVNWILTANKLGSVSGPLRSRCTIYKIPEPTREQIPAIIRSLVADFAGANGLRTEFFQPVESHVAIVSCIQRSRTRQDKSRSGASRPSTD
ncbi:AAA family ATPase [Shimia sagamensis]|uniref:ATPase family associated with various cellular activities (AAA) n=1 Tax=Shimia sagamensis TaxID=1566352 RepID=A0ABY1NRA4_9RHOB|nr:ATPase family associated with various cellular activities (AAA) [Shimia sagamensis]